MQLSLDCTDLSALYRLGIEARSFDAFLAVSEVKSE